MDNPQDANTGRSSRLVGTALIPEASCLDLRADCLTHMRKTCLSTQSPPKRRECPLLSDRMLSTSLLTSLNFSLSLKSPVCVVRMRKGRSPRRPSPATIWVSPTCYRTAGLPGGGGGGVFNQRKLTLGVWVICKAVDLLPTHDPQPWFMNPQGHMNVHISLVKEVTH